MKGLLEQLTLEEKAALTVGRDAWTTVPVERLGIPSVWVSDGPTGLRKVRASDEMSLTNTVPATCFPTESSLAATWDVALVEEVAGAIATECRAEGVSVLLGPGINLKRSPLGGRNFEYFSEDPVLSGRMAAAFVRGLQDRGVGACLKHLVANEHETGRMYADSIVDERTLREVYLRPFEIAVHEADPWTVMASYNRLNGEYCVESRRLLREILVEEWGFPGIVMSDWLAVNDRVASIEAGLHLQMPGSPSAATVVAAVREGRLDEARLDELVRELLAFVERATAAAAEPVAPPDLGAHHRLARRTAAAGMVLLKNDGALLPLAEGADGVALIGAFAREPRYQGAGSSQVKPTQVENLHDELPHAAYARGYSEDASPDPALLREAQEAARGAQLAIVCVGLPAAHEREGVDRQHIELPEQHNALVEAVLDVQPNTVVVLTNGSAVAMPWAQRAPAILEAWLGGQGGGGAIADVLLGRVNPSGRLSETFPVALADTPAHLDFPGDGDGRSHFTDRLFTGYRSYDARGIEPLFPFGHGLSYTTFEYSGLRVDDLTVTLSLRNTGQRAGAEVVQLYVRERAPRLRRPDKELRAFAKPLLEPGEQRELTFRLEPRDFASYDTRVDAWRTDSGEFDFLVGASSRDIRLQVTATLELPDPVRVPLDRLTPLSAWLARPGTRERIGPALAKVPLLASALESAELGMFVANMPIAKLVMLGALDEAELAEIIATANGARSSSAPASFPSR
jgi:beta-glucosidase